MTTIKIEKGYIGLEYLSRMPKAGDLVRVKCGKLGTRNEVFGDFMRVDDIDIKYPDHADAGFDEYGDETEPCLPFIRAITISEVHDQHDPGRRSMENTSYSLNKGEADTMCLRTESGLYYVNLYLTDREFGGAEEGGWYYSTGHPVDCHRFSSRSEAYGYLNSAPAALMLEHMNTGRPALGLSNSRGVYHLKMEPHMAKAWPVTRPRYS
jgi:hypothetical protein|tara:strand:+ start:47 stop:673 length:627 start_codon:yes stop_codon:yes gene_type:complete